MSRNKPFLHYKIRHEHGLSAFFDARVFVNKELGRVSIDNFSFDLKQVRQVKFNRVRKMVYVSLVDPIELDSSLSMREFIEITTSSVFGE